jgi:capsular polysaccharide transport system permease protein
MTLLGSLRIQVKVIWALFMREVITRFGRHNIGFLWLFVEPMLFTLGVATLWSVTGLHRSSELPIIAFALTGYSTVLLWRNMPARSIGCILPNSTLMYHRNVKVMDIFISRLLLEIAGASASFLLLSCVFISIGWMHPPENILLVLLAWLLTAWFGMSLAIFLGTLSEFYEAVEKLWHPSAYLLFPLSGAAFLVDAAPASFQGFILWIPMVHATEMVRDGYFGSKFTAHYSISYFALCSLALSFFGLVLERRLSREIVVA